MKLRLGTRKSLLAMAQARQVAVALRAAHPDIEIEFVGITTGGDTNKTTPLPDMQTIGIFTKEIDDQLLAGEIDFAVHSLKDLGTQRPADLVTGAIPRRAPSYDVALFRPDIMDILRMDRAIKIGTSAPRRGELVPKFLTQALPRLSATPAKIEMVPVRGNIDTRLKRLHEMGDRALDGIILAFAGLSRLHADEGGRKILADILHDLKWKILPLTHCPGAPGQGALAIECRAGDIGTIKILSTLNHSPSAVQVRSELDILGAYGGGCHQRFGVTAINLSNMKSDIILVRGCDQAGQPVDETHIENAPDFTDKKIWRGRDWQRKIFKMEKLAPPTGNFAAAFAANSRALPDDYNSAARLWTSGVSSWFNLAAKGHWVEGCADGFGFDFIRDLIADPVLQLPPISNWAIYTHEDAADGWVDATAIPTYKLILNPPAEAIAELASADVIEWSSSHQFAALHQYARYDAIHVCGPGKTADYLYAQGVKDLVVLPLFD